MEAWILSIVVFLPLLGGLVLLTLPAGDHRSIRHHALATSLVTLLLTVLAVVLALRQWNYVPAGDFVLEANVPWVGGDGAGILEDVDIRYHLGLDGVSLWLLVLTSFMSPLAIWASYSGIRDRVREYYLLMLLLQTGMAGVFCSLDLLLFFVFFEFTLIPLFFIIGIWGGPEKRRAANKFFIFTVSGSVLTFGGVLYLAWFAYAKSSLGEFTFDINKLYALAGNGEIPASVQWWLFAAFAAGFAIKVPFFPVHTWLPLAHTEAPTAGSVILAGVLLKLGTYGFMRLSVPLLPEGTEAFAPFMAVLAVIGIIYGALAAWVQTDIKKLVAYSSVSHLGFCMLGLFSLKMAGVTGSLLYMVNHGLSTGALFLIVGMIYERYHTRQMSELGGLAQKMPWCAFFLIFFTLSSIGLPGLNGFVSEFLVLLGTALSSKVEPGSPTGVLGFQYVIPAATGIILSAIYMLWMCQRVLFGPLNEPPHTPDLSGGLKTDLNKREISILVPIALACLFLGVYPKPVIQTMQPSIQAQVLANHVPAGEPDLFLAADTGGAPSEELITSRVEPVTDER